MENVENPQAVELIEKLIKFASEEESGYELVVDKPGRKIFRKYDVRL